MMLRRSVHRLVSLLGAGVIVFAQMAVAAHACAAAFAGAAPQSTTAPTHASMHSGHDGSPCGEPEPAQTNLCFSHCLTEQQSVDQHPISFGAPFAGTVRYLEDPADAYASPPAIRAYSHALLAHVTAPPLSVRNCCFRT